MRLDGTLKFWNDDRGFGFIEPALGGQEIFVHIKAFRIGSGRPYVGQVLTFEIELDQNGRKRACSVEHRVIGNVSPRLRCESPAKWTVPRLLAIPVFFGVCYYVSLTWGIEPVILIGYLIASIVAFITYALDKAAAVRGNWRTRESTLHILGLVGGWPGSLLAQQFLRHKSSKPAFVANFWITVGVNIWAFIAWHADIVP